MALERTKESQEAEENGQKPAENEQEERDENTEEGDSTAEDSEDESGDSDDSQDEDSEDEQKPDDSDDPRVAALEKENARLRGQKKDDADDVGLIKGPGISAAEKSLFNSWQEDAKAEVKKKYPQLEKPEVWKAFVDEFMDRISIPQLAKRRGRPVTQGLIRERFEHVAQSIGLQQDIDQARQQGRAAAMRNRSEVDIYRAGSINQKGTGGKSQQRQRVLPKAPKGGMKGWYKKPKTK